MEAAREEGRVEGQEDRQSRAQGVGVRRSALDQRRGSQWLWSLRFGGERLGAVAVVETPHREKKPSCGKEGGGKVKAGSAAMETVGRAGETMEEWRGESGNNINRSQARGGSQARGVERAQAGELELARPPPHPPVPTRTSAARPSPSLVESPSSRTNTPSMRA